jgi:PhnB protein
MPNDPTIVPYLAYEDGVRALEWLVDVFGFEERTRYVDETGRLLHGEVLVGDGVVMLASPTPAYESPARHRDHCASAARWSESPWLINGIVAYVDDVDAHHARAKTKGARVLTEPEDAPPARRYRVEDCEGQRWMFMER